jgi:hypothetical protein
MRLHDLRHTYASLARSAGTDLKLLPVTMGHASVVVTAHSSAVSTIPTWIGSCSGCARRARRMTMTADKRRIIRAAVGEDSEVGDRKIL